MAAAQNSWKITMNKKVILSASAESEEKNRLSVSSSDWKAAGTLEVEYSDNPSSAWLHSIHFMDENRNDILVRDSTKKMQVNLSELRKAFSKHKEMKIYLMISPPDPLMMAPTRLIHLATIKLP